jgi:hypothetical protein
MVVRKPWQERGLAWMIFILAITNVSVLVAWQFVRLWQRSVRR